MNSKNTGFLVKEKFPNLINKWELHTGGYTSEFIENIGYNIDLVYIDTVHYIPGEMFNWLEISPLLKEETFVVLHDTFFIYKKNSTKIVNYSNICKDFQPFKSICFFTILFFVIIFYFFENIQYF